MAVEDGEELNLMLWLLFAVRLNTRLLEVKNDADPVLIVVTNETIMSIRSISNHVGNQRPL